MLKNIDIRDYAIIEHLTIGFDKGFTVLTGETGAGKSIIMGALSLVMGGRSDAKTIRSGAKKCIIEATFDISSYDLAEFFNDNDLDYYDECQIRREVSESGKSRAFVNDTPVNLSLLHDLGGRLIDIHSQHANLQLKSENFQLSTVDYLGGLRKELDVYVASYSEWREAEVRLKKLKDEYAKNVADKDYVTYQLEKLNELNIKEGEQEELEAEQRMLTHGEEILGSLSMAESTLDDEQNGVITQLKSAYSELQKASGHDGGLSELAERIHSVRIELDDVANEISSRKDKIEIAPGKLDAINERLDNIYMLEKKYGVETDKELIALRDDMQSRLDSLTMSDDEIVALGKSVAELKQKALDKGCKLSEGRSRASKEISARTIGMLKTLGMKDVRFSIETTRGEELTATGIDKVVYEFQANAKAEMREVSDVASGGEAARIMLVLKAQLAQSKSLPTIIFDEIDTGVSGEIAARMAAIMHQMGESMQVICITHLPQIASAGQHHYRVYKSDSMTKISILTEDERVKEIAGMLSSGEVSLAAMENARVLLGK